MSNPPDKPGRLAIVFFEEQSDLTLLNALIYEAQLEGYKVVESKGPNVLLERGY